MALLKCHECGNPVSSSAATCPQCGAAVRSTRNRIGKAVRVVWYILCALVLVIVFRACYGVGEVIQGKPSAAEQKR